MSELLGAYLWGVCSVVVPILLIWAYHHWLEHLANVHFKARNEEHDRRVYYQNIVYYVCNALDELDRHGTHQDVVCGTVDEPCDDVQRRMDELLAGWKDWTSSVEVTDE